MSTASEKVMKKERHGFSLETFATIKELTQSVVS